MNNNKDIKANAEEKFVGHFTSQFDNDRLANVKFFVRGERVSASTLRQEIVAFEDACKAGKVESVLSLGENRKKVHFNAAFA